MMASCRGKAVLDDYRRELYRRDDGTKGVME